MMTRIILAGPRGKMGAAVLQMINHSLHFELAACIDHKPVDNPIQGKNEKIPVFVDPVACLHETQADVLVDFTVAEAGFNHCKLAIEAGVRPVIGTSGITDQHMIELKKLADTYKIGCVIAPNFSLGAVLLKEFARQAARLFPKAEIIEKHHDQKLDAPSGTAIDIANTIQVNEGLTNQFVKSDEHSVLEGINRYEMEKVPVHSVRLPGLLAHHEVIFGGNGESLTLKHDSYNRDSFMDGVARSVQYVLTIDHLIHGLEHIMMQQSD